jgi:hypothetical protein
LYLCSRFGAEGVKLRGVRDSEEGEGRGGERREFIDILDANLSKESTSLA